jgi:hypothetical protein
MRESTCNNTCDNRCSFEAYGCCGKCSQYPTCRALQSLHTAGVICLWVRVIAGAAAIGLTGWRTTSYRQQGLAMSEARAETKEFNLNNAYVALASSRCRCSHSNTAVGRSRNTGECHTAAPMAALLCHRFQNCVDTPYPPHC